LHETKDKLETTVEELTAKLHALEEQHKNLMMTHDETVKEWRH